MESSVRTQSANPGQLSGPSLPTLTAFTIFWYPGWWPSLTWHEFLSLSVDREWSLIGGPSEKVQDGLCIDSWALGCRIFCEIIQLWVLQCHRAASLLTCLSGWQTLGRHRWHFLARCVLGPAGLRISRAPMEVVGKDGIAFHSRVDFYGTLLEAFCMKTDHWLGSQDQCLPANAVNTQGYTSVKCLGHIISMDFIKWLCFISEMLNNAIAVSVVVASRGLKHQSIVRAPRVAQLGFKRCVWVKSIKF